MQDYTRLLVWQKARSLTVTMNEVSRPFRPGDAPGLRSQLMRASMSISATIAEGAGRESRRDFARFVSMSIASASEVENHLLTAGELGVISDAARKRSLARCIEVRRMLHGLRKALLQADVSEQPRSLPYRRQHDEGCLASRRPADSKLTTDLQSDRSGDQIDVGRCTGVLEYLGVQRLGWVFRLSALQS